MEIMWSLRGKLRPEVREGADRWVSPVGEKNKKEKEKEREGGVRGAAVLVAGLFGPTLAQFGSPFFFLF
jgi:hypothetical protein